MKTPNKSARVMGFSPTLVRLCIGLAALLGGLLLAFVLLMILNALTGREAFAGVAHSLPGEGSAQVMLSVDPPCGTLDGITIDSMETVEHWHVVSGTDAISAILVPVTGYNGQAIQLSYNLSTTASITADNWVQLRRDFTQPIILPTGAHLRFYHQGTTTNTLQIGLVSADGQNYFSFDMNNVTHVPWWTYVTWDIQGFHNGGKPFTYTSPITAIFISVKKSDDDDVGGFGSFTVDELQYLDIASRTVPSDFECVTANPTVTQQAAAWVASQQQPSGLLKSWQEESADYAWLYDQALGLIVLSETDLDRAEQLATKLNELQNDDGSWYAGYYSTTITTTTIITPIVTSQPIGANAWTIYALSYYSLKNDDTTAYQDALEGAGWLASLQRPDGSLPALPGETTAPTEPNLDAWWAFQATDYLTQADKLQTFLLDKVWDNGMGRFKSSSDTHEIFLDNQTWGAAFLRAVGREADARRALSYARWTLATTSSDGSICGFDGAGPFSVWNEGTLQYVAQRGENSQYYWNQMVRQQVSDGGMPGSPDSFRGYIVWLTPWHGIAPTSWLYFAGTCGPFPHTPHCCVFLPLIIKE